MRHVTCGGRGGLLCSQLLLLLRQGLGLGLLRSDQLLQL